MIEEIDPEVREKILQQLNQDAKDNYISMTNSSTQLNRRNYIRSLFALYEAILESLRIRAANKIFQPFFSGGELNLHSIIPLLDETPHLGSNGEISLRPNANNFKNILKYTLTILLKDNYDEIKIFNGEWSQFCDSIKIRHRIMHPKLDGDIEISDTDLVTIELGSLWWNNTIPLINF